MSDHIFHLIGSDDDETATITAAPIGGLCHITFRYRDRVLKADAADYFEALCKVRAQLELEQLVPFCYGASLNVFPSGMCRDMSAGLKAYRLTRGKKPGLSDLVGIFDEGADVIPASVTEQREYFDGWLKSNTS